MTNDNNVLAPTCGPEGCSITANPLLVTPSKTEGPALELRVVSDAICPWCYVAKRHMETALAQLRAEGLYLTVRWLPFELNPDMPAAGLNRQQYRTAKFGSWARSQALDAQVAAAGKAVGLSFQYELMKRTPNTFNAHRLIWLAGQEGLQNAVVEGLFRAYFTEGRDIGDTSVLIDIATAAGIDRERVSALLASPEATDEVRREIEASRDAGLQGVPTFILNGHTLFSGAQPASVMAAAFRKVAGFDRSEARSARS